MTVTKGYPSGNFSDTMSASATLYCKEEAFAEMMKVGGLGPSSKEIS